MAAKKPNIVLIYVDDLVSANPELADLLSFASSEEFGRILTGG